MEVISRRVVMPHCDGRAPLCGCVAYTDREQTTLLRRIGWEIANDIHDDFADQVSTDHGRTWSELAPSLGKEAVEGGYICHTENALLLLPDGRLLHVTNDKFEASLASCDLSGRCRVRITIGTAAQIMAGQGDALVSDFGVEQGIVVSFVQPIVDSRGRVLIPVQWQRRDGDGAIRRMIAGGGGKAVDYAASSFGATVPSMRDVLMDVWEVGLLIGVQQPDGGYQWRLSQPVPYDFRRSSRGMMEPAITELPGGRLAMVLRGSNARWPDLPGYKWLTISDDGGATWSVAEPWRCCDGSLIESGSSGSMFFRSFTDGRLYWVGNLCTEGRRPNGNMPRSPLHIARVCEDPFGIEPVSITAIDFARAGEHPDTQHSNFKLYQDRSTGEAVVYLTRYGQRGYDNMAWIRADLYEYRVKP